MWDTLAWLGIIVGASVMIWFLSRLVRKAQDGDRSRGNPDNWDPPAGHHG